MLPSRLALMTLVGAAAVLTSCSSGPTKPLISSFTCTNLPDGPGTATFSWAVSGAVSTTIEPTVGPVTPPSSGSTSVQVTTSTTYTLTATNLAGNSTATCTVTVEQPPVINSFTATPSTLPTGGGSVALAWDVTGANSLFIDGGVGAGAVTPVTVGMKTVLVAASTTFTLTATDDAGSVMQSASVVVLPLDAGTDGGVTINGTVVDNDGLPIAGETVVVSSDAGTQTAVTNAAGQFSVSNVKPPYSATVVESTQAIQYQGLTRQDPSLSAFLTLTASHSATLSGQFTGGSYPEAGGYKTVFLFASQETITDLHDQPSGSYASLPVKWAGPTSTSGALYAIQIHTVSGLPADYPGYGTLSPVVLPDMGSLTGQNVGLGTSPVTTGTLSGTIVSVPAGYAINTKAVSLGVASGVNLTLVDDVSSGSSFSYVAPSISGTQLLVTAAATSALGEYSYVLQTGLSANSTVMLTIPASPSLTSPSTGATGVTATTPFSWTDYPGGIHEFVAFPHSGSGPTFYILTEAVTVDLADAGLPLPASTAYDWEVIGLAPVSTVDVLAAPGGINKLTIDLNEGFSATRSFTTGP